MTGTRRQPDETEISPARNPFIRGAARNLVFFCILIAVLFFSTGRLDYWQGWPFIFITAVQIVVMLIQSYRNPDLAGDMVGGKG
jgi:hypothetical protein